MNEKKKTARRGGMDPILTLTLIFTALKLAGRISWSWLWVLSPVWLTALFFTGIFAFILVGGRIKKGRW